MKRVMFLMLLVLSQLTIIAHEGKHEKKSVKQDTLTIVGKDTIAVNGHPKKSIMKMGTETETKEEAYVLKPDKEIFAHLHNKVVHFPIAMGLLAFLFSLINLKWKDYDKTVFVLVVLGLIFSLVAFFTVKHQAEPFFDTGRYWVVELHQNIGISILITYFVWLFFLLVEKIKKYAWIIGLITSLLILSAGFLGGVIAH